MNWPFEFKLWKSQRKRRRTAQFYSKLYQKARKEKKPEEELESIEGEARSEDQIAEYEIESLVTWHLISCAEHLFIPIPDRKDEQYWKEAFAPGEHHLTPAGVSRLRDAIRDEEKKRREARVAVLDIAAKLVVMLTGLIGATIGLVSILKK